MGFHLDMDEITLKILRALQRDCRIAMAELGNEVGLSASACHRRVKQLEDVGIIAGYSANLSRRELGYRIEFFVEIELNSQSEEALNAFEAAVRTKVEILECHMMAGGTDYMLRVVASDIEDYERIHRERLAKLPHVSKLRSNLAIRTVRSWSGYPLHRLPKAQR